MKYIIVKKATIESFWKIEAESYNKAVEKYAEIRKTKKDCDGFLLISPYLEKEYDDWQVYEKCDMQPGVKKFKMVEK